MEIPLQKISQFNFYLTACHTLSHVYVSCGSYYLPTCCCSNKNIFIKNKLIKIFACVFKTDAINIILVNV